MLLSKTCVVLVAMMGVCIGAPSDLYNLAPAYSPGPAPGYSAPHGGGGRGGGGGGRGGGGYQEEYNPIPYNFEYGVSDEYHGTNFNQNEESDGEVVRGSYTVLLPDGRKQTVTYVADPYTGYQAEVTYYGEAKYPQSYGEPVTFKPQQYSSQPSYQPEPSYQSPYQPEPTYQPSYQPSYQPEPSYQPSYQPQYA